MPFERTGNPTTTSFASLNTIDFSRIAKGEPAEVGKLLQSCQTHGFFYLDLTKGPSSQLLQDVDPLLRLMEGYFGQPLEIKARDDLSSMTLGYFPMGLESGVVQNSKDGYEGFRIPHEFTSRELPPTIEQNIELFNRFIPLCDSVLRTVLHGLSTAITGQRDEFDAAHDPRNANNSTLMLLHYPKQSGSTNVGHNKHTDLGSLTLVLTRQGGLQVWIPEAMTWQFVEPRVGHAVVNVGDSLRFLSGNRLYSALHRVLPTDRQTLESRYSICYFLRPGDEVKFKDMEGREVTGQQWHDEKHKMFQTTHEQQSKSLLLTGGMEQILGNVVGTLE